ncbi:UTRA domain-containing protein [Nocardiopsis sp. RSe5-2]|uniref:UTRA domain-containing protein n=1 Tax=Nocardiopsis endophytica TaxID=3018445 RepID=A0ABT4TZQ3_9ACTN|nr:UTRA domain-containing protein [Nocardiopsis endophytica]MDA2810183.1 UTRA domain-containing protein [Nocardiopsis endophytica]
MDKTVPPDDVRRILGLAPGVPVACRRRRYADTSGNPVELATSFVPLEVAGEWVWRTDTGPGGIYARLADQGWAPARFREEVRTRPPTASEAELFRTQHAVADVVRTAFADDGSPVEVARLVLAGHRHVLSYAYSA